MIFGLGFELLRAPMLKSLDTARPLRVMSEKSVFRYLEEERQKSRAQQG